MQIVRIAIAADYVDRLAGCREALWRVIRDGREGGAVASAIDAMMQLCFHSFRAGRWDEAGRLAGEGLGLCQAHGYRLLAWLLQYGQALLAAARGDYDTAEQLTDEITRWAGPRGGRAVQAYACHARALAAMGQGDFERAYQQAAAVSPAGVFAAHVPHALRVAFDLVESAVRTGRHAEAAAHVAVMRELGLAGISPRLALIVTGAAAIAAPDHEATSLFAQALAVPAAGDWPFDLARVQLAYGERLRRARATTQARQQLGAALDIFRRPRARPWQVRAENELRAAGLVPDTQETKPTRGTAAGTVAADPAGVRGRDARGGGPDQQADRRTPLSVPPHRGGAPLPGLPEARRHLARRAEGRPASAAGSGASRIDQTIVSIAAPTIQHDLGLSSSGIQWAINAYLLALAAFFAYGGRLADTVGHRTMVVAGVIIFAARRRYAA